MSRILAIALLCLSRLGSLAEEATFSVIRQYLDEAGAQLARGNVLEYEQALQRAWQTKGAANDRVEAAVALARAHCWIHHDPAQARRVLAAAWVLGAKPALPLIELAALEMFEGDYAAAGDAARSALSLSTTTRERREARTRFGEAVRDEILQDTLRSAYARTTPEANPRVQEAVELLLPLIRDEPGWLEPSRCQVFLGLLAGNGPAALLAWQSYFLLLPSHQPKPPGGPPRDFGDLVLVDGEWTLRPLPYTEPGEVLARLLPAFTTRADAVTRKTVVRALAGSRFFPEAAALALRWNVPQDQAIRDIILYGSWTDNLDRLLSEEYRQHALGKNFRKHFRIPYVLDVPVGRTRLEKIIAVESKRMWEQWRPDTAFRADRFGLGVGLAFGAVMRHLEAPNVFNYGHSVLQFDRTVEQYGRQRVMKWVILDGQVCRGYGAWLWSAAANRSGRGVGGWANPPAEFVQTRNQESLYMWETLTNAELNHRLKERVKYWSAKDDKHAQSDPYGYLRGLSLRLIVRANERLLERCSDKGIGGAELRTTFLRERERLVNESNVAAHEGRHALDLTENPTGHSSAELEFRAKCSQVVFAPDTLLAVGGGNIFSPNINPQGSGHGLANARIMRELTVWMEDHALEIPGLDTSRPLLPQFDLLNDEQMRQAFRSMDPWRNSEGKTD